MKSMRANRGWASIGIMLAATACGGGAAATGGGTGERTTGGERPPEPIACSVPNAPEEATYQQGANLVEADDASGIPMLETACTAGNPCACSELGEALWEGHLVQHDRDRAITLSDTACEGGEMFGCWHAGYMRWIVRPEELETAVERYHVACEGDTADACSELGRFAHSGGLGGVPADHGNALLEAACLGGSTYSCFYLGQSLAHGVEGEPDMQRATELLAFACIEAHVAAACTEMAYWAESADADAAHHTRDEACQAGDHLACDALLENAGMQQGTSADSLDLTGAGAEHVALTPTTEETVAVPVGGTIELSSLGLRPACLGAVSPTADAVIDVLAGVGHMDVRVMADTDTTIAVRDPSGAWHCSDDAPGGSYFPEISVDAPAAGAWVVWAGRLHDGEMQGSLWVHATPADATATAAP
jgi:hypothetical protein